jgi:CDP-4-dehydro-6-deoxyglucose reductase, E3
MRLAFEGNEYQLAGGESVLDCLDRHQAGVPSYCRNGVCQTCLMRAEEGAVPVAAQQGLKETWKAQGWFLSCMCRPAGDMRVARCDGAGQHAAQVLEVQPLSSRVLRVRLTRPAGFEYAAGQFIQLVRPGDGLMRPYSLASTPEDPFLELHVAQLPQGKLSGWLAQAEGQQVTLRGPYGECFYVKEPVPRPLLLVGTGTGLAPLYGVLRTAIAAGHGAAMRLIHGAADAEGLYLWSALRALAGAHRQLECTGSVQAGAATPGMSVEPLQALVQQCGLPLSEARIYVCGNPDFVRGLRKQLYLAGTPLARIHADPFLPPADPSHS